MLAPIAALALAVAAAGGAAPVRLTFAWPEGAEGARTERSEITGTMTGERGTASAVLRVARAGDGWRVDLLAPEGTDLPPLAILAGADGSLRSIDGEAAFRSRVVELMRRNAGPLLDSVPGMREAEEKAAQYLIEAERTRWSQDISRWAGKTLVAGATVEELRPASRPGALPTRVRYGLRRTLPCPGDASRACVELWERATTDDAARRAACGRNAAGPNVTGEDALLGTGLFAGSSELVVVADPATLLPFRVTWHATSRQACEGGLRLLGDGETTERAERTYAWRRP